MGHETAVAKETELRQLDRLAMLASVAITLVPLLPYALTV